MATTLNQVTLIGRTTSDISAQTSSSGTPWTRFSVAIDRPNRKDGSDGGADFVPCSAFGHTAQYLAQYAPKGSLVLIEGSISVSSFKDKQTGQNRQSVSVNVRRASILNSRRGNNTQQNQTQATPNQSPFAPQAQPQSAPQTAQQAPYQAPTQETAVPQQPQSQPTQADWGSNDDLPF